MTPVSFQSPIDANGSSARCSTFCVRKVCSKTWAASAKALSTSPRRSLKSSAILVSLRPLRCLRSAKVPAGLSSSCTRILLLGGLDLVEDRRQLLVFGDDQLRRLLGDVGIGGEHHGDRLADEVHLVDRQDRLIVECRAVIGLRDDLAHVLDGDDAIDAGHLLGRAGVDRLDAAVGDGAAEDLAVQHAGKPHGVGVFGAPGDLRRAPRAAAASARSDRRRARLRRRLAWWWLPSVPRSVCCGLFAGPAAPRGRHRREAARACRRPSRARPRCTRPPRRRHRRRVRGRLSSTVAPASTFSALLRRVAFSVAALTTTRADLTAGPSASSATATPSAGQSSAEPVVTFI